MTDKFAFEYKGGDNPATNGYSMLAGGSAVEQPTRAVYVGGTGDLTVEMLDGATLTFIGVQGGTIYPMRIKRVLAGTTATNIVGLI